MFIDLYLGLGFAKNVTQCLFLVILYTQGSSELQADYQSSIQVKIDCFLHIWELIWSCAGRGESLLVLALILGRKYEGNETRTF